MALTLLCKHDQPHAVARHDLHTFLYGSLITNIIHSGICRRFCIDTGGIPMVRIIDGRNVSGFFS
jgi:hypothetical protein